MAGLKLWAHESRTCNMHMERLFICIIKSLGFQKSPDVVRIVSAGTLTQILKDHLQAGGSDPRFVTRQQLLDEGAPLECALEAPTKSKAATGFGIQGGAEANCGRRGEGSFAAGGSCMGGSAAIGGD